MTTVIKRRPEAARQRTALIFYFYLGYFPSPPPRRLRWSQVPGDKRQHTNPHLRVREEQQNGI